MCPVNSSISREHQISHLLTLLPLECIGHHASAREAELGINGVTCVIFDEAVSYSHGHMGL